MKSIFPQRLYEARSAKKMSQLQLATKIGISQESVSAMELGKTFPRLATVVDISDVLGCSVDYLIGKTDIKTPAISAEKLDEQEKYMLKNFKVCSAKDKEILMVLSDLMSGKKIKLGLPDGISFLKSFDTE